MNGENEEIKASEEVEVVEESSGETNDSAEVKEPEGGCCGGCS